MLIFLNICPSNQIPKIDILHVIGWSVTSCCTQTQFLDGYLNQHDKFEMRMQTLMGQSSFSPEFLMFVFKESPLRQLTHPYKPF